MVRVILREIIKGQVGGLFQPSTNPIALERTIDLPTYPECGMGIRLYSSDGDKLMYGADRIIFDVERNIYECIEVRPVTTTLEENRDWYIKFGFSQVEIP